MHNCPKCKNPLKPVEDWESGIWSISCSVCSFRHTHYPAGMQQKNDAVKPEELPGECRYCGEEIKPGLTYCDSICRHMHKRVQTERCRQTNRRKRAEGNMPIWWF
jgi:hypothetical protein